MMRIYLMLSLFLGFQVIVSALGFAQDAATAPTTEVTWWKPLLEMASSTLLPALWAAIGPVMTAMVTKGTNVLAQTYIPRSIQVILSGLMTASIAGLTGDMSTMVTGGVAGMSGQILAATRPESLLTSERVQ